jgi:hypothetical protein
MKPLKQLTSSNNDVDLEVIAFGFTVLERKVAALVIPNIVRRWLALPLAHAITMLAVVVLWGNNDCSMLVGGEFSDNIAPSLVVVNTQSNDESFIGVGHETKRAT